MAEVIETMPPARGSLPWAALFDGQAWRLARGSDYEGDERIVAERIRGAARRRQMVVVTSYSRAGGVVCVQATACLLPRVGSRMARVG